MKPLLKLLLYLYPAPWRARYGEEMYALIDDAPPRWRDLFDIPRNALAARIRHAHPAALALTLATAGSMVALAFALFSAPYYESSTEFIVTPDPSFLRGRVMQVLQTPELRRIIDSHGLYRGLPNSEQVERFRRNIHIGAPQRDRWRISFLDNNPATARSITQSLAASFEHNGLHISQPATQGQPRYAILTRYTIRGAIAGLLLALCAGFWRRFSPAT